MVMGIEGTQEFIGFGKRKQGKCTGDGEVGRRAVAEYF